MKKLLICLLAVALSNCEVSVNKSNAQGPSILVKDNDRISYDVLYHDFIKNGMKYRVVYCYKSGLTTINLTKDSLEVEYYRKQLKQ